MSIFSRKYDHFKCQLFLTVSQYLNNSGQAVLVRNSAVKIKAIFHLAPKDFGAIFEISIEISKITFSLPLSLLTMPVLTSSFTTASQEEETRVKMQSMSARQSKCMRCASKVFFAKIQ